MQISKYNANGNDFIIVSAFKNSDRSELARKICDRHSGVGADGFIVILPHNEYDFAWEFYNSDGSMAKMCGNGSRAAAFFAYENGLCGEKMRFLTQAGVISAQINRHLKMTKTALVESELTKPKLVSTSFHEYGLEWYFYDTGVPHLVSYVSDISEFDITLAKKLRHKYNSNVNFAKFDGKNLLVRTYERGVEDETKACGTGMAACFYVGVKEFGLASEMIVVPSGKDELKFKLTDGRIFFEGEVSHTFDSVFYG